MYAFTLALATCQYRNIGDLVECITYIMDIQLISGDKMSMPLTSFTKLGFSAAGSQSWGASWKESVCKVLCCCVAGLSHLSIISHVTAEKAN